MSVACLECREIREFDTLILFNREGSFDPNDYVASYPNFYTCCATLENFKPLAKSRYLIVRQPESEDRWNTGSNGPKLGETAFQYVDEVALREKLPKIYEALVQKG